MKMNLKIQKPLKIISTGKYVPERKVSSEELEQELGIEPGWTYRSNGIMNRHRAKEEETGASMGANALKDALGRANMKFEDLDLLIEASASFDYPIPHNACLIPIELGLLDAGVPCWDVDSSCLGFVTALDMVSYLLDGKRYSKIAIVNSELTYQNLNPEDPKTVTLFGDAATAVIVSLPEEGEQSGIITADLETYSGGAHFTRIKAGGNANHTKDRPSDADLSFEMKGKEVMRMAMMKVGPFAEKLLGPVGVTMADIHCVIPHQASKRALDFAQKAFNWTNEQMVSIIADYGNCISASIPLALHEAIETGRLKRGEDCLLFGTAAGLSVGGLYFIY